MLCAGASDDIWIVDVVEPSLEIIKSFLDKNNMEEARSDCEVMKSAHRDLWTQYICKVSDASSILVPSPLVFFSFFVTAKL